METSKVVTTIEQLVNVTGLDNRTLEIAKILGCPYFDASGRKDVEGIKRWVTEHQSELDNFDSITLNDVKKANQMLDGQIKKLTIAKLKREQLDPDEVATWAAGLALTLSGTAKTIHSELRVKCVGFESVIDTAFSGFYKHIEEAVKKYGCRDNK